LREHLVTPFEERAMSPKDLRDIRLDGAGLEPLGGEPTAEAPLTGKARFSPNTRTADDRRKGATRREAVRFQDDRRAGTERRPRKGWEKGKNL
jgi:hypothetical protein